MPFILSIPIPHHKNNLLLFSKDADLVSSSTPVTKTSVRLRSTTIPTPIMSIDSKRSLSRLAPLEAILFDIDGTLCDSDPFHYEAFREMLLEMGYNNGVPITEEFFAENISGKHNDDIGHFLFPDWEHERAMKWMEDKEVTFRRLAAEKLEPVDGLQKLCKWVEDQGLKRAAVTNAPRVNAEFMLTKLELDKFFHVLVVGSECERAKPFPEPYLKALEVLKASPEHTFVFEDSVSGIKAGVAAGMPVIGITTRNPGQSLLDAGATFIIKDYEDPKLWKALKELEEKETLIMTPSEGKGDN